MRTTMMKSVALIVVLALSAGAAAANCGKKDTVQGTLKSVDAESNAVVIVGEGGKEVKLTLTTKTQVTDSAGKEAKVAALVGKQVKVVSEHAQVDSIQQVA